MDRQKTSGYIPFDLYDIFGYLFPGVIAMVYVVLFVSIALPEGNESIKQVISFVGALPWFVALFVATTFVVVVYVVGFFIGTVGSIFFDRVLVEGIYGYPIVHLLGYERNRRDYSEATHRYIFLAINLIVIWPAVIADYLWMKNGVIGLLVVIVVLIAVRVVIKWFKVTFGPNTSSKISDHPVTRWIYLSLSKAMEWVEENVLKALLGLDSQFPKEFKDRYSKLFKDSFGMNPENMLSENYWLSYFRATADNPQTTALLRSWLILQGFSRNLSAASYLTALGIVGAMVFYPTIHTPTLRIVLCGLVLVSWVFSIRYWVLYQNFHTKNVIRAFVASFDAQSPKARGPVESRRSKTRS